MRKFYSRISLAFVFMLCALLTKAQVTTYVFSQSTGTYTPITGGTVVATATSSNSLDDVNYSVTGLPFTFFYNGLPYTSLNINTNGFLSFGATPGTATYSPISSPLTGVTGVISAWGRDINSFFNIGGETGEIRYEVLGAAPNREIVFQWKNFRPTYTTSATSVYTRSFQIRLKETTNAVQMVYSAGSYLIGALTYSATAQIGLRGASATDYNSRTNATGINFNSSTSATANTQAQAFNTNAIPPGMPVAGLTYTYTPPFLPAIDIEANSVGATIVCPNSNTTITTTLKNTGTSVINFATNPATVTANVTGSSSGTATGSVSSGTLAPGATIVVTLSPTITVGAGNFNVSATVNMTGDLGPTNNTTSASFSPLSFPAGLTITPSAATSCSGEAPVMLTASGGTSTQMASANSGTISVPVPDATVTGASANLSISGVSPGATIDSMIVTVNLTHTWLSDMILNLKGPNGQIINLVNQRGGSGDNFTNTRITSAVTAPAFTTGTAPFTGTYRADLAALAVTVTDPATTASTFSPVWGEPNGTYTLYMHDKVGGDVGTLTNWSIIIYYQGVAYVWTPTTGLFTDAAGTVPYTGGSSAVVYAKPATTQTYSITATSGVGCSATASTTITAAQTTAITTQPTAVSGCAGGSATFTVVAAGTALTYQWRKDGVNITGATSSSYTIATVGMADAGVYDVIVTGSCAPVVTSNPATLSVNAPPIINTQPANQNVCPGAPATFTVTASGTGLSYQWRKGGVDISGATSASYTIASVSATDAGSYDVVVTTACGGGSTPSNTATLTLNTLPAITVQPQSVSAVCFGNSATFTVTATGTGLTYQWRKDGVNIPGATSSSYTVSPVTAGSLGAYSVVVSGTCTPAVTSNIATLATAASNSWIGGVSTAWNNAANWCTGVPTSTTDVLIPAGTTFAPLISATSEARNITVNSGASVTIDGTGTLNLYGNIVNNGTLNTSAGTIVFRGATNQSVPALTLANVTMNGAGGATLGGNMVITNSLTLTNGNITIGSNNITLPTVNGVLTVVQGSVTSHIITNGNGAVTVPSITTYSANFPVGFDAATYNPVTVVNGDSKNYTVKVNNGIAPAIKDPTKAINRTWMITSSSAPLNPVTILFQYADAHANAGVIPSAEMEIGVFANNSWIITTPDGGVMPAGTSGAKTVSTTTKLFGAFAVANIGSVDGVDRADLTSLILMPNQVRSRSVLRVVTRRATRVDWTISDATGRVVRKFTTQLAPGQNDVNLNVNSLPNGGYFLNGYSKGYHTQVLRFVKY